jgi:hypothetical protein
METQKVKVYLRICGDYVAFNEISALVIYDLTNNKMVDDGGQFNSFEEIQEAMEDRGDYCDIHEVDAVLVDGEYYYQID